MSIKPDFSYIVITPAGVPDPSLAIAGSRAGALGVLNLEFTDDEAAALEALRRLEGFGRGRLGVHVDLEARALLDSVLAEPVSGLDTAILTGGILDRLGDSINLVHRAGLCAYFVATSLEEALAGQAAGADAIIAKGHESGGWVGDETAFVLLQRLLPRLDVPVWVQGGIGLYTAAACLVAGAAGVVLDSQLLLTRESPITEALRARLRVMDGSETVCLGRPLGAAFRAYSRPDLPVAQELRRLETTALRAEESSGDARHAWRIEIRRRVNWRQPETSILAMGQDAAFAAELARRFETVGGVLSGLREAVAQQSQGASRSHPLAEGAPLAASHGTRYPIVQGPMTRVSDRAEFASAVADAGGLPFLALALMRGPEVKVLLEETQRRLGERPWGVGILGFVPPELREEQLEVIRDYRPPFALIAGGRPDQSRTLESEGIPTYLHVPSPGLLRMFLAEGATRFVFEGRECGGHVGPRTSFVLWETMIGVLVERLQAGTDATAYHVLFAGGVHDSLSSAMVATISEPLARRGIRIGVLMGTAYLFTREAVQTGAIVSGFQQAALACDRTVLLESGPGHATRCVESPFVADFTGEKRRLTREGLTPEQLRQSLEVLNIGRLRVASKGVDRDPRFGHDPEVPKLVDLEPQEQWRRGMYMIGQVAALRDALCTIADLHRDVTEGGARWLESARRAPSVRLPEPEPAAVAIVGMACILPGAPDLRTYWSNILNKVDAITEVPTDRWDWREYFDPDRMARDKIYSRWGGFIGDVPFDPATFGMPPSSLRSIEPFQLLALVVVRSALEDAGHLTRPFPRERTSVILGAGGGGSDLTAGYMVRSSLPHLFGSHASSLAHRLGRKLPEWTEDSFPGLLMNVAAGRVANRFDLGGVNYTVDAACASSLAAVYLAVRDLESRTSDMAVVGGVDAIQNPFAFLCFSKTQALSPNGRCRTFDAQGDGIAISEGFAALVMKRLEDAERDGDRVYAVIRGVGGSSDGRDRSMTAPRPEGQVRALRRAYGQAGFSPGTVGLIEAHGTGTVAGDQAEVQALSSFFGESGAVSEGCAIGSVKSMIGHTKAAAGVAGLIKVALSLYHRVLPPTLGVTHPNPKANFSSSPFYVNTETRPWIQPETSHPRRAGVSAFGFGGTNFHVVAEEYTGGFLPDRGTPLDPWPAELLLWRGRTPEDIIGQVTRLAELLEHGDHAPLADLTYMTVRQAGAADRERVTLAIVAGSRDELVGKLRSAAGLLRGGTEKIHEITGIHFSAKPLARDGKVAFLFPGQGSQYVNMARDLAVAFAVVRDCFERADRHVSIDRERVLSRLIFPPPTFDPDCERLQEITLTGTDNAQPALGATDIALFYLLRQLGVTPNMLAGHSFGEFVALCAGGCFSEETLLQLAAARGRFILECTTEESGAMAAVIASPGELRPLLAEADLTLANLNSPRQTVISGTRACVEQGIAWCKTRGLQARLLPVACAFHSALVAPAQSRLAELLRQISIESPRLPVFSNATAAAYPEDSRTIADILCEHLVRPVEFVRQIEAMYEAGARLFVEVGPRNVLTGLIGQILGNRSHVAVPLDVPGRPTLVQLLHALATVAAEGVSIQTDHLFAGRSVRRLELSQLARKEGQTRYSSTTWLVNGGSARPAAEKSHLDNHTIHSPITGAIDERKPPSAPLIEVAVTSDVLRSPSSGGNAQRSGMPRADAVTAAFRTANRPQRSGGRHGDGITKSSLGGPMGRPLRGRTTDEGGTMSQSAMHSSRVSVPAPPQDRLAAPIEMTPPPPPLPPTSAQTKVELVRQFQQVMMRFLVTQETVMHDLLVFLDGQGTAQTAAHNRTRAFGFDVHGNGSTSAGTLATGSAPGPRSLNGLIDTTSDASTARGPVNEVGIGQRPEDGSRSALPSQVVVPPQAEHVTRTSPASELPPVEHGCPSPPTPRAATEPMSRQQLTERLLAIVSERTGYPEEMLALDADLEADLGIDSIKRVEIAGTVIRSLELPASQSIDIEQLTGSRTLHQVIDNLQRLATPASSTDVAIGTVGAGQAGKEVDPLPFDDARTGHGIGRFALKLTPASSTPGPAGLARDGVIVIVDDGNGVGKHLVERLGGLGYRVVRIAPRPEALVGTSITLVANTGSEEEIARLIAELHECHGPAVALVHLAGLRPGVHDIGVDQDRWRARLASDVDTLFLMAKALGPDLQRAAVSGGAAVLAVTTMGGSFAIDPSAGPFFPGHGGIVGFLKTLGQEWPGVRVKAVDVPAASQDTIAGWVLTELMTSDGAIEVGYRDGQRTFLELAPSPLNSEDPQLPLDSGSVILITGGARGITAKAALKLAETARPTLLLVGRTPLTEGPEAPDTAGLADPADVRRALIQQLSRSGQPITPYSVDQRCRQILHGREVRANLERIQQTGARVDYLTCDVRDMRAFGELIEQVYRVHGRIDGVIHGAGIIEDRLIKDKRLDSFKRVIETKVNSSLVLAAKLRPAYLRFLVFFSSVTGRFGNRGQGDYAAASEVLNKLAQDLDRRWPGRVVSINWGPWHQSGMVSPEVERQFSERGVKLIPHKIGCRMLEAELRSGRKGQVEILIGGADGVAVRDDLKLETTCSAEPGTLNFRHKEVGGPVSPPLLLATASTLSRSEGVVEVIRPLDPRVDLYLRDHCLDGYPVLPFAMAMELMAEVATAGWPELQLAEIRMIRLLRGVRIEEGAKPVRVVARVREERSRPDTHPPDGLILDVSIAASGSDRQIHYQAVIELKRGAETNQSRESSRSIEDLAEFKNPGSMRMDVDEAYTKWLFHGPLFQGITSIDSIGPGGMRGTLRTSSPRDCLEGRPPEAWLIDPVLVDSAFQMQVLWARLHWDVTLLPAGVQGCWYQGWYRPGSPKAQLSGQDRSLVEENHHIHIVQYALRVRQESQMPICSADHLFFGQDGRLVGMLTGVEGTGSRALNRLAGSRSA